MPQTDTAGVERMLVDGRKLATAGRLPEAEAILRRALAEVRGQGTEIESRACGSLGTFYGIVGRQFEALVLYRRGLGIDRARGDDALVVRHLSNIAQMYVELALYSRVPSVLAKVDDALSRLDEEPREKAELLVLWPRLEMAFRGSDVESAESLLTRIRETWGAIDEPRVQAALHVQAAELHRLRGRPDDALAALTDALAVEGISTPTELDVLTRRVASLYQSGLEEEAQAAAETALERLEEVRPTDGLCATCLELGAEIAEVFRRGGRHALARRAYDLAASATLSRIHQLDRCLRDLPELSTSTREDHAWLRELGASHRAQQREMLVRVARLLEAARAEGTSPLHESHEEHDLVRLCAWCGRVATCGGNWLPVAHFIPEGEGVWATHTICDDCREHVWPNGGA